MKITRLIFLCFTAVVLLAPQLSFAQYFSRLYDVDSSFDQPTNIRQKADGTLIVSGTTFKGQIQLGTIVLSTDGSQLLHQQVFGYTDHGVYQGAPGRMLSLSDNRYAIPASLGWLGSPVNIGAAALIKIDEWGDTLLLRSYTDTASYFESVADICLARDSGFFLAGYRTPNSTSTAQQGLLIRTDNAGRFQWAKTYQQSSTGKHIIKSVEQLSDGRLLLCLAIITRTSRGQFDYSRTTPWIIIADSLGNVLKEKIFPTKYGATAYPTAYADRNGGYYMYGALDSFVRPSDPLDFTNLPPYLAHLDTGLNITWQVALADTDKHHNIASAKQLRNRTYLLIGNHNGDISCTEGWAARIDQSGNVLWQNRYRADTVNDQGLSDAVELANGNLILAGAAQDHNGPIWHQRDNWVLGVDSNGCAIRGCNMTTAIPVPTLSKFQTLLAYPNPTSGLLMVETKEEGTLYLSDVQGRQLGAYPVTAGKTAIRLNGMATGIYTGKLVGANSGSISVVRLIYQP